VIDIIARSCERKKTLWELDRWHGGSIMERARSSGGRTVYPPAVPLLHDLDLQLRMHFEHPAAHRALGDEVIHQQVVQIEPARHKIPTGCAPEIVEHRIGSHALHLLSERRVIEPTLTRRLLPP